MNVRRSHLTERPDLIKWRQDYLAKKLEYERQGKKIYFLDESWINSGSSVVKFDFKIRLNHYIILQGSRHRFITLAQ